MSLVRCNVNLMLSTHKNPHMHERIHTCTHTRMQTCFSGYTLVLCIYTILCPSNTHCIYFKTSETNKHSVRRKHSSVCSAAMIIKTYHFINKNFYSDGGGAHNRASEFLDVFNNITSAASRRTSHRLAWQGLNTYWLTLHRSYVNQIIPDSKRVNIS